MNVLLKRPVAGWFPPSFYIHIHAWTTTPLYLPFESERARKVARTDRIGFEVSRY